MKTTLYSERDSPNKENDILILSATQERPNSSKDPDRQGKSALSSKSPVVTAQVNETLQHPFLLSTAPLRPCVPPHHLAMPEPLPQDKASKSVEQLSDTTPLRRSERIQLLQGMRDARTSSQAREAIPVTGPGQPPTETHPPNPRRGKRTRKDDDDEVDLSGRSKKAFRSSSTATVLSANQRKARIDANTLEASVTNGYTAIKCGASRGTDRGPNARFCNSAFARAKVADYRRHVRTAHYHPEERISNRLVPCVWRGCEKHVLYKALERHLNTHVRLDFKCPRCTKSCSRTDALVRHMAESCKYRDEEEEGED